MEKGRCKVGETVGKLDKNTVFRDFLVILEGKGQCYVPEICN